MHVTSTLTDDPASGRAKTSLHDHSFSLKQDVLEHDLKTRGAASVAPSTYPDAATLQDKSIYDQYLVRLNENCEFSKALMEQKTDELETKAEHKKSAQPLSEEERARIRERYSEKAKERRLRMYEKAILLAEEREHEEGKRYRSQRQLHFRVNFNTYFGQNVFVVGSVSQLGTWDVQKAIPLTWCAHNLWTGSVTLSIEDGIVEYKYIVKDVNTDTVTWEPGANHKVNTTKLAPTATLDNTWGVGD